MAQPITKKELKKITTVHYEAIRSQLKTSHFVFCSGSYAFSGIIQRLTKSTWSHVAVVYKDEELQRVMLLEAEPSVGIRLIPLSKYLNDYKGTGKAYKGQLVISELNIPFEKREPEQRNKFWPRCTDKTL